MANELNSYNIQSYTTIRFKTTYEFVEEDWEKSNRKRLISKVMEADEGNQISEIFLELLQEDYKEEKHQENMMAILFLITKKKSLEISKTRLKKIRKISRQHKEIFFDFVVYENSMLRLTEEKIDEFEKYVYDIFCQKSQWNKIIPTRLCRKIEQIISSYS